MFITSIRESPIFLAAQLVGIAGMVISIISFQSNKKKHILVFQSIASFIWGMHYVMLGAYTGAGINFIEVVRNLIFARGDKLKRPAIWGILFVIIFALIGYFTWVGILSLAITLISILVTLAFCFGNPRVMRLCATASSMIWLIYNGSQLSLAGVITESFCLISLLVAFWRFDIRKQPQTYDKSNTGK